VAARAELQALRAAGPVAAVQAEPRAARAAVALEVAAQAAVALEVAARAAVALEVAEQVAAALVVVALVVAEQAAVQWSTAVRLAQPTRWPSTSRPTTCIRWSCRWLT
jgi:hypothetical protein